jgi:hypothetical protein
MVRVETQEAWRFYIRGAAGGALFGSESVFGASLDGASLDGRIPERSRKQSERVRVIGK